MVNFKQAKVCLKKSTYNYLLARLQFSTVKYPALNFDEQK